MEIVWEIALQAVEILTLIFGILGMSFHLLLLFSPQSAKTASDFFNRNIDLQKRISYLEKDIRIDAFIYRYHIFLGACLIAGSIFALILFFFHLDLEKFANLFFVSDKYLSINKIVFNAVIWMGKIACLLGLAFGTFLLIAPEKMKRIENKLNAWIDTQAILAKLDSTKSEVDGLFFRFHVAFGLLGLVISFILIVLSVVNLMN
ncbi:MAG: hypothetical protein JSW39_28055 [Desulfobacterales bacterium]|nr:MAG: hypothetical protein JSW39_28055 [Desulfobacterales bacterium]